GRRGTRQLPLLPQPVGGHRVHLRAAGRPPGDPLGGVGLRLAGPGRLPPIRLRLGGTTAWTVMLPWSTSHPPSSPVTYRAGCLRMRVWVADRPKRGPVMEN